MMKITKKITTEEVIEFTKADALKLIATSTFRDFTQNDWYAYAGCESETPMIAMVTWNGIEGDVILDGCCFEFHFYEQDPNYSCHTYTIELGENEMTYQAC